MLPGVRSEVTHAQMLIDQWGVRGRQGFQAHLLEAVFAQTEAATAVALVQRDVAGVHDLAAGERAGTDIVNMWIYLDGAKSTCQPKIHQRNPCLHTEYTYLASATRTFMPDFPGR